MHPSCVQIAVNAVNASDAVRETRKLPADDCTSAALPVEASGDAASMVTVTVPLATLPLMVGSGGAETPEGPVGAAATLQRGTDGDQ